jgi:hypothetical protein
MEKIPEMTVKNNKNMIITTMKIMTVQNIENKMMMMTIVVVVLPPKNNDVKDTQ